LLGRFLSWGLVVEHRFKVFDNLLGLGNWNRLGKLLILVGHIHHAFKVRVILFPDDALVAFTLFFVQEPDNLSNRHARAFAALSEAVEAERVAVEEEAGLGRAPMPVPGDRAFIRDVPVAILMTANAIDVEKPIEVEVLAYVGGTGRLLGLWNFGMLLHKVTHPVRNGGGVNVGNRLIVVAAGMQRTSPDQILVAAPEAEPLVTVRKIDTAVA
jgi:hypothetical protein